MSELNWPELNTLVGVYEENALLKQRVAELEERLKWRLVDHNYPPDSNTKEYLVADENGDVIIVSRRYYNDVGRVWIDQRGGMRGFGSVAWCFEWPDPPSI